MINNCAMGSGYDFSVAWPTAEISFMDPAIGADVVYGKLPEEERQEMMEKMLADTSAYPAARGYWIQDIINPYDTRNYLIKLFRIIRESADKGMSKRLLANWPKKF